jgi:hypothetical protein
MPTDPVTCFHVGFTVYVSGPGGARWRMCIDRSALIDPLRGHAGMRAFEYACVHLHVCEHVIKDVEVNRHPPQRRL